MISISILYGQSQVTAEDRMRAERAAYAVLAAHGIHEDVAFADYQIQWTKLGTDESADAGIAQDPENLTGAAAVWVEAERAADQALTEGWHEPAGASCSLSA